MLNIARIKEILKKPDITDEEAERIRNELRAISELVFKQWIKDREKTRNNYGK